MNFACFFNNYKLLVVGASGLDGQHVQSRAGMATNVVLEDVPTQFHHMEEVNALVMKAIQNNV